MNKITLFLVIVIGALSFCLGTTKQSKAQDKNFTGIIPFVISNDRVGFFDQSNGRVYIYDNHISQCLFIGQIQSLGQPVNAVSSNPVSTINQ